MSKKPLTEQAATARADFLSKQAGNPLSYRASRSLSGDWYVARGRKVGGYMKYQPYELYEQE